MIKEIVHHMDSSDINSAATVLVLLVSLSIIFATIGSWVLLAISSSITIFYILLLIEIKRVQQTA